MWGWLDHAQRTELERADPRDIRVGTWFRWVWLAGCLLAVVYFALFYLPLLWYVARWAGDGVTAGVASGRFWWSLLVAVMVCAPVGATLWIAALGTLRRRTAGRATGTA